MPNKIITLDGLRRFFGKFAKVATTGSYNDLTDKPEGTTANDGKLSIKQNGTLVREFTANQSTNVEANLSDTTYTFAEGSSRGHFSVTQSGGEAQSVKIHGLGTAAYKAEGAFATSAQGDKADASVQSVKIGSDSTEYKDASGNVVLPSYPATLPASDVSAWAKAASKPTYTAAEIGAIPATAKGSNGGVAELDANGKIPTSQIPGSYDDVQEYASISNFPETGEASIIYVDTTTNFEYRWSGSTYVRLNEGVALGETSSTAYRGDRGKAAYDHISDTDKHITTAERTLWNGAVQTVKINGTAVTKTNGEVNLPAYPTIPQSLPASDTTDTYSATGTAPVSGKAVAEALGTLDVGSMGGAGKYIESISETNGKVNAVAKDMPTIPTVGTAAAKDVPATGDASSSQVVMGNDSRLSDSRTPKAHNQASNTITAMTGYSKPSSTGSISATDSLNAAIGKLEKSLDGKQASGSYAAANHNHDSAYAAKNHTHDYSGTYAAKSHSHTAADIGLGNVGNFKAVSTVAGQGLTTTEKSNARTNIGAGTSNLAINDNSKSTSTVYSSTKTEEVITTMIGQAVSPEAIASDLINDNEPKATTTYSSSHIEELIGYVGVTWKNGTDEQIVQALALADAGEFSPANFWAVGDARVISLSAISASTGVGESQSAQDIEMVIVHLGLYKDNNNKTVNAIVQARHSLKTTGKMNTTETNSGSWDRCPRRTWCNGNFYNAIPSTIRSIFKQFKTIAATGYNSSQVTTSLDYFALPAEKEIFGVRSRSTAAEGEALAQWDYYKTSANRIKNTGTSATGWWLRSLGAGSTTTFCIVDSSGSGNNVAANKAYGISPFGCI